MKEIYEKIFIKSEADLPKENGTYFVKIKTPPFTQELSAVGYIWENDKEHVNGFWLNKVDWYLRPVQSVEGSAEEIKFTDLFDYFDKWIIDCVGTQDSDIFSKGSLVRDIAVKFAAHIKFEEYAQSKQTAMVSDEEIEKQADEHSLFLGLGGKYINNIAKQVSFTQGAKWLRDKLKG